MYFKNFHTALVNQFDVILFYKYMYEYSSCKKSLNIPNE
jgi:hypothetical protein